MIVLTFVGCFLFLLTYFKRPCTINPNQHRGTSKLVSAHGGIVPCCRCWSVSAQFFAEKMHRNAQLDRLSWTDDRARRKQRRAGNRRWELGKNRQATRNRRRNLHIRRSTQQLSPYMSSLHVGTTVKPRLTRLFIYMNVHTPNSLLHPMSIVSSTCLRKSHFCYRIILTLSLESKHSALMYRPNMITRVGEWDGGGVYLRS